MTLPAKSMPLTTETTQDCQGIVHVGTGVITGDELVEGSYGALQLVQNTQNFHYEFVDLTGATKLIDAGDDHLDQITAQDRLAATYRPNAVVVIVAPGDDFFRLATDWEARVRHLGWNTHITRDRDEAMRWLQQNFPPPTLGTLESEIANAERLS